MVKFVVERGAKINLTCFEIVAEQGYSIVLNFLLNEFRDFQSDYPLLKIGV
jgi:hypothetical protein